MADDGRRILGMGVSPYSEVKTGSYGYGYHPCPTYPVTSNFQFLSSSEASTSEWYYSENQMLHRRVQALQSQIGQYQSTLQQMRDEEAKRVSESEQLEGRLRESEATNQALRDDKMRYLDDRAKDIARIKFFEALDTEQKAATRDISEREKKWKLVQIESVQSWLRASTTFTEETCKQIENHLKEIARSSGREYDPELVIIQTLFMTARKHQNLAAILEHENKELSATIAEQAAIIREQAAVIEEQSAALEEQSAALEENVDAIEEQEANIDKTTETIKEAMVAMQGLKDEEKANEKSIADLEHQLWIANHTISVCETLYETEKDNHKMQIYEVAKLKKQLEDVTATVQWAKYMSMLLEDSKEEQQGEFEENMVSAHRNDRDDGEGQDPSNEDDEYEELDAVSISSGYSIVGSDYCSERDRIQEDFRTDVATTNNAPADVSTED